MRNNEDAFTGLEAAIVLIAFVVVAAVFSYVMLGAGFYTTQKSQEVVHNSIEKASSGMVLDGDVIVRGGENGNEIDYCYFYVTNTAGGNPVDLNNTMITYVDGINFFSQEFELSDDPNFYAEVWSYHPIIANENNLLEKNEKFKIRMNMTYLDVGPNDEFKIEMKPPTGTPLSIERTAPPSINDGHYYTVH